MNEITNGRDFEEGYVVREGGMKVESFGASSDFLKASSNNYEITTNINTRAPMGRSDYDYWRPNERIPTKFNDVVGACRAAYKTNGTVRNVINLMVDFAVEDMRILHEDKDIETFYKVWADRVNIYDKIEEFARHILIDGNVAVKRFTGKLTAPAQKEWEKIVAKSDLPPLKRPSNKTERREIPLNYYFLDIRSLDWVHTDIEHMAGKPRIAIRLSDKSISKIKKNLGATDLKGLLADDIRKSLDDKSSRKSYIELDMEKLYVAHYKKDSWDRWADPYLVAVLKDLQFKNKLHQADLSALDGVINTIRLWKLGDHKEKIFPNQSIVNRLVDILQTNTGGGALDIVWDDMISMEEFYPPVDKILGPEKYTQVNQDILFGLGIPEVLLGGQGANFSNSWIQLKTIVEKLEFIRQKIVDWMQEEFLQVAKGMGFAKPAKARFGKMDLHDENISKKLIVGLMDRGIISVETVLKTYGEDYLVELERISRENKEFEENNLERKNPLDNGPDPEDGGDGRPPGTKEDNKRSERKPKPRTGSIDYIYASEIVDKVDKFLSPLMLDYYGIKNLRQVTAEQREEMDKIKLTILSNIKGIDDDIEAIVASESPLNKDFLYNYKEISNKFQADRDKAPTKEQTKMILAAAWTETFGE